MRPRTIVITTLALAFAGLLIFVAAVAFVPLGLLPAAVPGQGLTITAFADEDHWWTARSLPWVSDVSSHSVTVPRGFVTDLASIPPPFRSVFSRVGRHRTAAVIHDYLYWSRKYPDRLEADQVFLEAMDEFGVPRWRRKTIHFAVRRFGGRAWEAAKRAGESGEQRVIPEEWLPPPSDVSWEDYRERIRAPAQPPP